MAKQIRNEISLALKNIIFEKYMRIDAADVESFAPVYYPIAIVEMNLNELTFEDFEAVQLALLRFVAAGVTDYRILAETMGLSPNYVFRLMRLLNSYGHLDENGVTKLGRESLNSGKKMVESQTWQKFQVDALNGRLLKVEEVLTDSALNDKERTWSKVGLLNYLDGMPVAELTEQLVSGSGNAYIRQKGGILNTNVTRINEVRCTEIKYAKCYMMKLRSVSEPIVFGKRYDSSKKEMKERFSWTPFSVPDRGVSQYYGFEREIPRSTDLASRYTTQLYRMIRENAQRMDFEKEFSRVMEHLYPFQKDGITGRRIGRTGVHIMEVNVNAFAEFQPWIVDFLLDLKKYGGYLGTSETLYGTLYCLTATNGSGLRDTADLLQEKVEKEGRSAVVKKLREELKELGEGEKLIWRLRDLLL